MVCKYYTQCDSHTKELLDQRVTVYEEFIYPKRTLTPILRAKSVLKDIQFTIDTTKCAFTCGTIWDPLTDSTTVATLADYTIYKHMSHVFRQPSQSDIDKYTDYFRAVQRDDSKYRCMMDVFSTALVPSDNYPIVFLYGDSSALSQLLYYFSDKSMCKHVDVEHYWHRAQWYSGHKTPSWRAPTYTNSILKPSVVVYDYLPQYRITPVAKFHVSRVEKLAAYTTTIIISQTLPELIYDAIPSKQYIALRFDSSTVVPPSISSDFLSFIARHSRQSQLPQHVPASCTYVSNQSMRDLPCIDSVPDGVQYYCSMVTHYDALMRSGVVDDVAFTRDMKGFREFQLVLVQVLCAGGDADIRATCKHLESLWKTIKYNYVIYKARLPT